VTPSPEMSNADLAPPSGPPRCFSSLSVHFGRVKINLLLRFKGEKDKTCTGASPRRAAVDAFLQEAFWSMSGDAILSPFRLLTHSFLYPPSIPQPNRTPPPGTTPCPLARLCCRPRRSTTDGWQVRERERTSRIVFFSCCFFSSFFSLSEWKRKRKEAPFLPALDYYILLSLRHGSGDDVFSLFQAKEEQHRPGKWGNRPPTAFGEICFSIFLFAPLPHLFFFSSSSSLSFFLSLFLLHLQTGRNDGGQLGVGPDALVPKLSHPKGVRRWAALALSPGAGASASAAANSSSSTSSPVSSVLGHAAGVDGSGEVYTWGRNDHGQLGVPPGAKREAPARMSILKGWDVRAIACG